MRYKFEGLDWDYRPEIRNFGVLDKVQISPLSKEEIAYSMELLCKMEAAAALKIKTEELKKNIERKCSSLSQYMCSAVDTPKKQCPYCGEWYCNYHYDVNNNRFSTGGHVCG